MPIQELSPNPAPSNSATAPSDDPADNVNPSAQPPPNPGDDKPAAPRIRTGRYGELEQHELIHLLDSLDDERSRARFRESVYISTLFFFAVAWFLFYGPRVLFHQPEYKDLITAMKEHDKQLTYMEMPHTVAPRPPARAVPDRKTLQQLQQQPRTTPTAPSEPQPQAPPPPEQAHTAPPPVAQPALPLPSAPKPAQAPLVDAPAPNPTISQNSSSPHDAMQNLLRGARSGSGADHAPSPGSSAGPLQAGATILSDTMGVDFSEYMRKLHHDIQRNWDPLIPEEVQAPLMKKGIVGIRFTILPDGKVGGMTLEFKSGDVALDKAAWYAITSEGTFPPLPREFHGPQLELRVGFYYNTPIQQ
jgi:outer membrane biosynthesis protein TonB